MTVVVFCPRFFLFDLMVITKDEKTREDINEILCLSRNKQKNINHYMRKKQSYFDECFVGGLGCSFCGWKLVSTCFYTFCVCFELWKFTFWFPELTAMEKYGENVATSLAIKACTFYGVFDIVKRLHNIQHFVSNYFKLYLQAMEFFVCSLAQKLFEQA